jgi:FkbM family methyltransferase
LLFEPLPEYRAALEAVLSRVRGTYVLAAAGRVRGVASINLASNRSSSSLYVSADAPTEGVRQLEIPVVRIEDECRRLRLSGPYLIKLDVQGAELDALEGAIGILAQTEIIIVESSLFQFYVGAPTFSDIVEWMADKQFALYDICRGARRPRDNALAQVDLIFARAEGVLRRSHTFSRETKRSKS